MNYDSENIIIKDFTLGYNHGLAITTDGQLYGWGKNDYKQLGMIDTKNYSQLIKIEYFANYIVHEIHAGKFYSLIKASPKEDSTKSMFFLVGSELSLVCEGKTEEGVLHLTEYDNTTAVTYACGPNQIMFAFDGQENPSADVGVHHGYTCDVTKKTPIEGTMHFYKDEQRWHFLSKEGYEETKDSLPAICYATKYFIEDIQGKEWPEFDASDILEETKEHCDPTYVAVLNVDSNSILPKPKTSEDGIFEKENDDMNPLIYYRVARPVRDDKSLPELKLENYHKKTELFGIKVEADPDYSFMKNDIIMALEFEKYLNIQDRIKLFDSKYDAELLKKIEENLTMMQQNFVECPYVFLFAAEVEFEDQSLRSLPTENIQSRIDSLVMLNQYLLKSLPFLFFDEGLIHEEIKGETVLQTESLTACFILGKQFALESINKNYLKTVSDGLPTDYSTPSIEIDTSKIKKWYSENKCDIKGENTMFGQLFKKLKEKNFENLRIQSSTNYGWYANFSNEGIQNDGTFRKSVSQLIEELQSPYLPLFIPSKNNKDKDGEFQDRWVINPSCTTQLHLEMYKFIGSLIAMAFRAGHVIDLKVTPLFWKKFLCDPLKLDDLAVVDNKLYQVLKQLSGKEELKQSATPLQKISFTTELSDGTKVKLIEEGDEEYVDDNNAQKYIDLVLSTRFQESKKQMNAIKAGFDIIFPSEVARVLDLKELEERVRGHAFDIEKIKTITDYSSMSSDDEWGLKFWNIIKEFTPEMQTSYLRSVGGRTRLPLEPRLSEIRHKVYLKDNYYASNHDESEIEFCPESFNITLPRYSTEELMKEKLIAAIKKSERYYHSGDYQEDDKTIGAPNNDPSSDGSSDGKDQIQ